MIRNNIIKIYHLQNISLKPYFFVFNLSRNITSKLEKPYYLIYYENKI
jgi:hypothetical protein